MADQSRFIQDFENTLVSLDRALGDAARSVVAIRSYIPQFAALAQVVATVESAVAQAHQNLDLNPAVPAPAAVPSPVPAPATQLRAVDTTPAVETPVAEEPQLTTPPVQEEAKPASGPSQVLRLHVTKTKGSLDLKSVDSALNEHAEIVDLALLDYDGRQATLKVWVSGPIDQHTTRQSLTADLLERVGGDAEVKVEFDQESAAA